MNVLAFRNAAISIGQDPIILFLHFLEVIYLSVATQKKAIPIFLSLLGSFAYLASII